MVNRLEPFQRLHDKWEEIPLVQGKCCAFANEQQEMRTMRYARKAKLCGKNKSRFIRATRRSSDEMRLLINGASQMFSQQWGIQWFSTKVSTCSKNNSKMKKRRLYIVAKTFNFRDLWRPAGAVTISVEVAEARGPPQRDGPPLRCQQCHYVL